MTVWSPKPLIKSMFQRVILWTVAKVPEKLFCGVHTNLFPFVLVDLESLHSDWLTGVVHETMRHTFGP